MITLVINLDRDWDFCSLVRAHALDLYQDRRVDLWDVRTRQGGDTGGVWGDWPRLIPEDKLLAELEEVLVGEPDRRVLVVFLLDGLSLTRLNAEEGRVDGDSPARQVNARFFAQFSDKIRRHHAQDRVARVVAVSPIHAVPGKTQTQGLCQDGHLQALTVLGRNAEEGSARPDADRRRFLTLRALLALFGDPTERERLWRQRFRESRGQDGALRLSLEGSQIHSVARIFRHEARLLLQEAADNLRRNGSMGQGSAGLSATEVRRLTEQIEELVQSQGRHPDPGFVADLVRKASGGITVYHPSGIEDRIARLPREFSTSLDSNLESFFQSLSSEHHSLRGNFDAEAQRLEARLSEDDSRPIPLAPSAFSDIEATIASLREHHERIAGAAKDLRGQMQGDLTSETRRNFNVYGQTSRGYRRPYFQEEERVRDATQAAITATLAMMSWPAFLALVGVATGVAVLPLLAEAVGWGRLSGLWPSWMMMGVPLAALVVVGLGDAIYRSRMARQSLLALADAGAGLASRAFMALSASYRYVNHSTALYRLSLLVEHQERVRARISRSNERLRATLGAFQSSHDGVPQVPEAHARMVALKPFLQESDSDRWMEILLMNWPSLEPVPVSVIDHAVANPGKIETSVFYGVNAIHLQTLNDDDDDDSVGVR